MGYRDRFVAHDGSEGLSPDGWLPDRISVGVLTRAFPPELVDEVIEVTGTREQRRRLLPARLMVYFVLACATRRELFRVEVEDLRRRVVAAT